MRLSPRILQGIGYSRNHRLSWGLIGLVILVFGVCAPSAMGQGFVLPNFSSTSGLTLDGRAAQSGSGAGTVLRLTPASKGLPGAAWYNTAQPVAGGFTTVFTFQISDSNPTSGDFPADGFAFVIQNDGRGTAALDTDGGGSIGYGSSPDVPGLGTPISNSLAVEFDTYQNTGDPDANHIAVQSCGMGANNADETSACNLGTANTAVLTAAGLTLTDQNPHTVQIDYRPSATCAGGWALDVTLLNSSGGLPTTAVNLLTVCVNLSSLGLGTGGTALVGFTGATGAVVENNDILNWQFFVNPVTQPLQGGGVTNSFNLSFMNATYNVIYPADITINNTTMTISTAQMPQSDCNNVIDLGSFGEGNQPTCTTYNSSGFSAFFDVMCSAGGAPPTSQQCPTTSGYNPYSQTGVHNSEDIRNFISYTSSDDLTGKAPQVLTAPEVNLSSWVPYGVGATDCTNCTRGSGGSGYNSLVVLADFPTSQTNPSPFAIPPYQFAGNGFSPPVSNTDQNLVKAGQTIPLKWCVSYGSSSSLGFNGGPITSLTFPPNGFLTITATPVSTASIAAFDDNVITTQTNAGLLNLGNGCYNFGWATKGHVSAGQSYIVSLDAGDGHPITANFTFTH
jgi:hypothetical protein